MGKNIRNMNDVNHTALYKSVDPFVSVHTGLIKKYYYKEIQRNGGNCDS